MSKNYDRRRRERSGHIISNIIVYDFDQGMLNYCKGDIIDNIANM